MPRTGAGEPVLPRRCAPALSGRATVPFALLLQWPSGQIQPHIDPEHAFQSVTMIAAFFTVIFGIVGLPLLLALGGVPLFFASVRASRWQRAVCIVILCIPCLLLLNVLCWMFYLPMMEPMELWHRTHTVRQSTVRAGIPIPAGSTLIEPRSSGGTFTVQLKSPVRIDGALWSGKLTASSDSNHRLLKGTLGSTATYHGIACAPGKATFSEDAFSCTLARDTPFRGFTFAEGSTLEYHRDGDDPVAIDFGVPVNAFTYGGVVWPEGVSISNVNATREELQKPWKHGAPEYLLTVCLPENVDVSFQGVILHGPVQMSFQEEYTTASNTCGPEEGAHDQAFGSLRLPHAVRHSFGEYHYATRTWEWLDKNAEHTEGHYPASIYPHDSDSD